MRQLVKSFTTENNTSFVHRGRHDHHKMNVPFSSLKQQGGTALKLRWKNTFDATISQFIRDVLGVKTPAGWRDLA